MSEQTYVTTNGNTEVRLVTVENEVKGIKGDVSKLEGTVGKLETSMVSGLGEIRKAVEQKGHMNWPAVAIGVTVMIAVAGWGWALFGSFQGRTDAAMLDIKQMISSSIAEQKATVGRLAEETKKSDETLRAEIKAGDDAIHTEMKSFISRPDLNDKFNTVKEKRDAAQAEADKRVDRIEEDLKDTKKDIVPIGTHKEQWGHQDYLNQHMQKQIEDNRKKIDDLFNGRDEIHRLINRLDKIEDREPGRSAR